MITPGKDRKGNRKQREIMAHELSHKRVDIISIISVLTMNTKGFYL